MSKKPTRQESDHYPHYYSSGGCGYRVDSSTSRPHRWLSRYQSWGESVSFFTEEELIEDRAVRLNTIEEAQAV